ncbi:hypothetical protein BGZ83_000581 [Gryganskiella cystojenkinii]|nr:hypothetical protein BGZ83_000581 [Gryganskiella cystojenkinii]
MSSSNANSAYFSSLDRLSEYHKQRPQQLQHRFYPPNTNQHPHLSSQQRNQDQKYTSLHHERLALSYPQQTYHHYPHRSSSSPHLHEEHRRQEQQHQQRQPVDQQHASKRDPPQLRHTQGQVQRRQFNNNRNHSSRSLFMNPDPYLETPHLQNPSSGTLSLSVEYDDVGEEYSISSMENEATTGYKNHSSAAYTQESLDPRLKKSTSQSSRIYQQHYPNGAQTLSTFATPQSSPQSSSSHQQSNGGHGADSYHSSSGSEDDRGGQEPALLGQLSRASTSSSTYRARRDSGLPPLKMSTAKRLPPFSASLSSMPAGAVLEEEEEEEDLEEEEQLQGHHRRSNGHEHLMDHEEDVGSIPQEDDDDREVVQVLDRDMDPRQLNQLPRSKENNGSKQSDVGRRQGQQQQQPQQQQQQQRQQQQQQQQQQHQQHRLWIDSFNWSFAQSSLDSVLSKQSSFHPFPSPPTRTMPSTVTVSSPSALSPLGSQATRPQAGSGNPPVPQQRVEPDRGPADLSNPSMALAEALIAARSKAEGKAKALQKAAAVGPPSSNQDERGATNYSDLGRKMAPSASSESNGAQPGSQVRIPVPNLSPTLRSFQTQNRNSDELLYRRTSFTLSPTSSNPELAESQTDSHSGSYGTPRPNTNGGRPIPLSASSSTKFLGATSRAMGPSISSNMSAFSDEYSQHLHQQVRLQQQKHQQQPQQQRRSMDSHHNRDPSLLGTSYDSANSAAQDGGDFSRYAFPEQNLDQSSLPTDSYTDSLHHHQGYQGTLSEESSSFQQDYINARPLRLSTDSEPHAYTNNKGKSVHRSFSKQQQQPAHHHPDPHDRHTNGLSDASVSASVSQYPPTASSMGEAEDLQDQMNTEAEYIMTRNTELLRILSIRDEEIQTLQQELDHTLKVMHEYEDDLMAMHTAAAKPYESYHQTLDEIGHEMTQQDAIVKGYQHENEMLTSQLKSSVEIRQEAEKRHLHTVEKLKNELIELRAELDRSDNEKYGSTDLRTQLKISQDTQAQSQKGSKDKEEEYLAEISALKDQLKMTEQVLEDERRAKVEEMQKLERDIQDFRAGYDGMLAQLQSFVPHYRSMPPLKRGSSSSSADDGQADTTAGVEIESDLRHLKASPLQSKTTSTQHSETPSPTLFEKQVLREMKPKTLDRKLTSTETLTTANMPKTSGDVEKLEKLDLEQRISQFEADVRQSLLRSASIESFISVRSSTGTVIPLASQLKSHPRPHGSASSRDDLRLSAMSEEHKLANKLRDRINSLNVENKRLHAELSSLSHILKQQQAERQRRVAQLEELLDMHENMAGQKLDDADTDDGQTRIRKVIQGLMVKIRTKEAEAEFYHNAYLDKVMELDQMALANGKTLAMESSLDENGGGGPSSQSVVDGLAVGSGPSASMIEALENRVKELERINKETAFRLAAEQRRAQAAETENATLVREKLTLARMLEDQVEQLQSKLSAADVAKARLEDENTALRQQYQQQHDRSGGSGSSSRQDFSKTDPVNSESMATMRTRLLSLTRQRDQLREQLQEAFDIQLTMQERNGGGGVPEWSVDDYKRLERALEEKSTELSVWKERAVALEKVVERIRMIKDRPEPIGLSMDRYNRRRSSSSAHESAGSLTSSTSGRRHHSHHHHHSSSQQHTLEELDQVVLRLEQRLERRDQELQEVVQEAKRQTDLRLEGWKSKWVQVVQRKNAEIHRFQVELESLMAAVDRDRARMAASMKKQ